MQRILTWNAYLHPEGFEVLKLRASGYLMTYQNDIEVPPEMSGSMSAVISLREFNEN